MTPLKTHWLELYKPITENLKLDMRMNLKTKKVGMRICEQGGARRRVARSRRAAPACGSTLQVEIRSTPQTVGPDVLQKAADFVHAFLLGAPQSPRQRASAGVPRAPWHARTHAWLAQRSCCGVAGFEVRDAIALLRLDDLYIECFEIKDVKVRGCRPGERHDQWQRERGGSCSVAAPGH